MKKFLIAAAGVILIGIWRFGIDAVLDNILLALIVAVVIRGFWEYAAER